MSNNIIMSISGSKVLSNTWKQELQIREDGVYGEVLVVGKRAQMFLAYEDIAQVNITRRVLTSELTLINKGGTGNLTIQALKKNDAEKAKNLIQQKIEEYKSKSPPEKAEGNMLEKIEKLHALLKSGALTEEEFSQQKIKILNQNN